MRSPARHIRGRCPRIPPGSDPRYNAPSGGAAPGFPRDQILVTTLHPGALPRIPPGSDPRYNAPSGGAAPGSPRELRFDRSQRAIPPRSSIPGLGPAIQAGSPSASRSRRTLRVAPAAISGARSGAATSAAPGAAPGARCTSRNGCVVEAFCDVESCARPGFVGSRSCRIPSCDRLSRSRSTLRGSRWI